MTYYWIRISCNNVVQIFKKETPHVQGNDFAELKQFCGMEYAECVYFTLWQDHPYMMLVDEEGKLKNKQYNALATQLYHNPYDAIVGDVAILGTPYADDMTYMSEYEKNYIIHALEDII